MASKKGVVWYVEPRNARTSLAIADFLESGEEVELHRVEVDGKLRNLYRLEGYPQLQVLEETRLQMQLHFNIIRERGGKKEDITAVMRKRAHRAADMQTRRPKHSLKRLIEKGAVRRASSLPRSRGTRPVGS